MLFRKLKGITAREANQVLGHTWPFWQDESYDRLVREVVAGLVSSPALYEWSSASEDPVG